MRRLGALVLLAAAGCTSSLDSQAPRFYRCQRDGGPSCPAGWTCGLSGYCQDPAVGARVECNDSSDCTGGWHCGVARVCYDRAAAEAISCAPEREATPDAGDCAPTWRCGLAGTCHPRDAGRPYACQSDSDCEAQWRCGPERACVDVSLQALTPAAPALEVERASPLLPAQVEAASVYYPILITGNQAFGELAYAADGGLTTFTADNQLPPNYSRMSIPLPRPLHALLAHGVGRFGTDSAGLWRYDDALLKTGSPQLLSATLANAELRFGEGYQTGNGMTLAPAAAAFKGGTTGVLAADGGFDLTALPNGLTANDLTFTNPATTLFGGSRTSLLAATGGGLYYAPRSSAYVGTDGGTSATPAWRRAGLVELPGSACADASPPAVDRVKFFPRSDLLALVVAGKLHVFRALAPPALPPAGCWDLPFKALYTGCDACGAGEQLFTFGQEQWRTTGALQPVETVCRTAAGRFVRYVHPVESGACALTPAPMLEGLAKAFTPSSATVQPSGVSSTGAFFSSSASDARTYPERLPIEYVSGGPAALFTSGPPVTSGNGTVRGAFTPGLGLMPFSIDGVIGATGMGSVEQRPELMLVPNGGGTLADLAVYVEPTVDYLAASGRTVLGRLDRSDDLVLRNQAGVGNSGTVYRAHAVQVPASDGRPWLVIGASDRIWATDEPLAADAGTRAVGIKTVPLPYAAIGSLTMGAPAARADGGTTALLEGYAVAQLRLFRVVAQTKDYWRSDEIVLPGQAAPLKVWLEGERARVGTTDGRVFGLPVPVVLTRSLPNPPLPQVLDYAQLCGQGFALARDGLYRLRAAPGEVLGSWERVPLDSVPGYDSASVVFRRLHVAREGGKDFAWLFSEGTLVLRVSCTP